MATLPNLAGVPIPFLPPDRIARTAGRMTTFDAGRGCPFQCSFCTIINVQGRKSRYRSADDVEGIVRTYAKQKITRFFITDDNFARNRNWEAIFDRLIQLREQEGYKIRLLLQVDTLCHRIPNFIKKARRAGVLFVFIGLENINPQSLMGTKKRQNKIWEYREMLQAWRNAGVMTYCGYILGLPTDTPESIHRDIEIIKKELPLDVLEFFCLTPLPGSEDHKVLTQKGVGMDPDMNKYDLEHVVAEHKVMTQEEWHRVYLDAWDIYYTREHMRTILRRSAALGTAMHRLAAVLFFFSSYQAVEKLHPIQGGLFRLKYRRDRRPSLPMEPVWAFYPKYWGEVVAKHARMAYRWFELDFIRRSILRDPQCRNYTDQALSEVSEDESETMEMLTQHEAARNAVERARRIGRAKVTAPA
jgi:hypothetical protein